MLAECVASLNESIDPHEVVDSLLDAFISTEWQLFLPSLGFPGGTVLGLSDISQVGPDTRGRYHRTR